MVRLKRSMELEELLSARCQGAGGVFALGHKGGIVLFQQHAYETSHAASSMMLGQQLLW